MTVLDLEQVRSDLLAIIDENPDAKGRIEDSNNRGFYYFVNQFDEGLEISDTLPKEAILASRPCCLVGRLIARRPELLDDGEWLEWVSTNTGLGDLEFLPGMSEDASKLVIRAQDIQDQGISYKTAPTFGQLRCEIASFQIWDDEDES